MGSRSGYQHQTKTMTIDMKEHLKELYKGPSGNQPDLSENSSDRYVLRGSFRINGVQLHLNAINTRVITERKYSRSENRHKPDMELTHNPREGYDSHLCEVQNMFPDRNAVLSVSGDDSANKNRPWVDIDVLAHDLGEGFTVRSFDYLVTGVNEFYTSKMCPNCERSGTHPTDFVGSITIRQLFCEGCKTYFHRDEMAASNMVNAICSQLQKNKRPNYVLPIDESGKFVIKRQSTSEITARDQHTSTGKRKAEPETQILRKRHQTLESEADSRSNPSRRKRKAEPETQTLRTRHQTWESEADSESDSSWQSTEEEEEEEEKEGDDGEEEDDEWEGNKS
ncbi:hypothetical protein BGZ80_003167 [Entomortierella chlamydospora]|uniref:Cas12f1-like TNB domain-containing protein n=1 Tax=Entomortierella chlamydospora TaxID=101097 RepID=A0A9P6MNX1_9FUNG|nr:hypothetical protein BGZ79_000146 [Entomortierella chlamydospora]KAG0008687.1 hypothetical protein BGZ80_003167 [Entomortierella chlamydospora]